MIWIGIDLKKDWNPCRVEDNPTSTPGDAKHVGLTKNAQAFSNSPTRGNLAQKPTYPTSKEPTYNDLEKTNSTYNHVEGGEGGKGEDAQTSKISGFEKFKACHAAHRKRRDKHTCSRCGKHDDIPFIMYDYAGYYCETCRREGPPSAPPKVDAQIQLSEVA